MRNEARSTTRESTLLYNQARRAMRSGNREAADVIGQAAGIAAVKEVRNPLTTYDQKEAAWNEKKAMEAQADIDNARQVRDARDYNAAGYVKPTADVTSATGQRQKFFNEMVGQARLGTLDINKAKTDAQKSGLNLHPEEWAAGLDRLPKTSNLSGSIGAPIVAPKEDPKKKDDSTTPVNRNPKSLMGSNDSSSILKQYRSAFV